MGKQINPDIDHSADLEQNALNLPLDGDGERPTVVQDTPQPSALEEGEIVNPPAPKEDEGEDGEDDLGQDDGKKKKEDVDDDGEGEGTDSFEDLPPEKLNKLTPREKAFYRDLRKERERRQKIETERDFLLLQKKYGPSADKQRVGKEDENVPEVWQDPLASKDPDDVITLKELQARDKSRQEFESRQRAKLLTEQNARKDAEREKAAENSARINARESSFRKTHPDYDDALKLAGEVIKKRPSLAIAIRAEMDDPAGDPISAVYELAKQHPDYANIRGKKDTKDNASRIVRNASKPRTIANMSEQGGETDDLEGMDAEELGKALSRYSEAQLSRVPRKLRDKALRGY